MDGVDGMDAMEAMEAMDGMVAGGGYQTSTYFYYCYCQLLATTHHQTLGIIAARE